MQDSFWGKQSSLQDLQKCTQHSTAESFESLPHYTGGIWKRSFISTVRLSVHTNPAQKRSFSKTLFKSEEFENADFPFSPMWTKNILKTELFDNDDVTIITWFSWPSNTNPKMTADCCVSKFIRCTSSVDGNHFLRFQSEFSCFNSSRVVLRRGIREIIL